MRFTEFKHLISEETINPNTLKDRNSHYYRNLINLINDKVEVIVKTTNGARTVKFKPEAARILQNIWNPSGQDAREVATPEQVDQMKNALLPAADGNSYRINQIEKTKDIKQKIGAEGEVTNSKWWNKGNVAEGIMACAVVTKFERQGDIITGEDVFLTAQKLSGKMLETEAYGKRLQLKIVLSSNDFKALLMSAQQPQEFLKFDKAKEVYKLYMDTATYVNESNNVKTALKKIEDASDKDIIAVTADGATAEAQHSTKADLWIAVGNKKERLLSIKTATVKHIGAVSGYEFHHINAFFESVVGFGLPDDFKSMFKSPPSKDQKMSQADRSAMIAKVRASNYANGTKKAYQYIFKQINNKLKGDDSGEEYDFVTTVTKGVVHHATLGEDVRLVIISPSAKKAYTELEFGPNLYAALENYDLVPYLNLDGANYKLLVYGYPKTETAKRVQNDASMFVQLRSYVQDNAARNVVEIGGLLKNLTDVSKLENTQATSFDDVVNNKQPAKKAKPPAQPTKQSPQPAQPATTPVAQAEPVSEPADELAELTILTKKII